MTRALKERTLPNGRQYCLEFAETEAQQDACAGDLEDGFFLSEQDKARALTLFNRFMDRLRLQRNPCGFWKSLFNRKECEI